MGEDKNESGLPIEYLIDVISSVKSALTNIDRNSTQNHQILSELSENINMLTELYKKQNQDHRTNQAKLDTTITSLGKLSSKLDLTAQTITSENEKINSNIALINQFKKDSLSDINESILALNETVMEMQSDMTYLRERESHKEVVEEVRKKKSKDKDGVSSPFIPRITGFLKHLVEGIGTIYKIMFLIFVIALLVLSITGVITWQDFKNIMSFKIF
jgi:chromosome segregation ATPase